MELEEALKKFSVPAIKSQFTSFIFLDIKPKLGTIVKHLLINVCLIITYFYDDNMDILKIRDGDMFRSCHW